MSVKTTAFGAAETTFGALQNVTRVFRIQIPMRGCAGAGGTSEMHAWICSGPQNRQALSLLRGGVPRFLNGGPRRKRQEAQTSFAESKRLPDTERRRIKRASAGRRADGRA